MSTRWFTSDLHLGDPWTTRMRWCGEDTEKHDLTLAKRWDSRVQAQDEVWVLGDVAVNTPISRLAEWLKARPGTKHLVLGNHDDWARVGAWKALGFDIVTRTHTLVLNNVAPVWLNHYPMGAEASDTNLVLHGHTHRREKVTWIGSVMNVQVGWEAWRRPVSEAELIALIEKEGWR